MRVLVAPDKFRGTLTASQAAAAIRRGWSRARPADELRVVPLADGGEGTLEAIVGADGELVRREVTGPRGDPVTAPFGIVGDTAVVELARASGLALLAPERHDPLRTTTRGTGELIRAALDAGARRVLVCVGGSATNDGGVGMATALGAVFLDFQGNPMRDGGGYLSSLGSIDVRGLDARVRSTEVVGLVDVDNPLTGLQGASAVFAPQKGADGNGVLVLDRAMRHLAAVVERDLGLSLAEEPGAGAAGGTGFGLMAFLGARLRPGVEVVMETVGFEAQLRAAELVITGEGSFDEQSLHGKVPAGVLAAAEVAGVDVAIVCGVAAQEVPGVRVRSLVDRVGREVALGDARASLELVAEELAREVVP